MAGISRAEQQQAEKYVECEPKQFGDMHQRMKHLIEATASMESLANEYRGIPDKVRNAMLVVWNAVYDLETEVKHHEPKHPPFGRRTVRLG